MKQLNKLQNIIFAVGAVLMVVGAAMGLFLPGVAPFVYAVGAVAYTSMQLLQSYEGNSFTIRRLRRIMILSDVLLLFVAVLLFVGNGNPLGFDQITYISYVRGNWVPVLLLAAVLQFYTAYRISSELEQEAKKR